MSMRSLFAGIVFVCALLLSAGTTPAAPPDAEDAGMICRTYQVADLVIPIAGTFAARTEDGKPAANRTHEDRLMQLICSTLSPKSWSVQGGAGTIDYYPLTMALVVRQRSEVQEQVAELLAALRRIQDVEVSVELRFITVSDECLNKLGIDDPDGGKASIARLDESQVRLLLETAQADNRTNVLQAPKVTVFNGQKATLDLTEKQTFVTGAEMVSIGEHKLPHLHTKNVSTGLQVSMLPVVSADNRIVTLQLGVSLTRADVPRLSTTPVPSGNAPEKGTASGVTLLSPLEPCFSTRSFETTLKLPDRATALICGWTRHREVRNQTSTPVLGKIPYIGRLFSTLSYGKESEHLLVMVTPRVIVLTEKEESAPPEAKPTIGQSRAVESSSIGSARSTPPADSRTWGTARPAPPATVTSVSRQASSNWIAYRGRLRVSDRSIDGKKSYVIDLEDQGYVRPLAYVSAGQGVELDSQVGNVVEVLGPAVYRGDLGTNYMTVMQVSP